MDGQLEDLRRRLRLDQTEAAAVLDLMTVFRQICEYTEVELAGVDADDEQAYDRVVTEIAAGAGQVAWSALTAESMRALLGRLAEPAVANAFAFESDVGGDYGDLALRAFVDWAAPAAPEEARAAMVWLRAMAFERHGMVEFAEATLLKADSSWPPALLSLAGYACDRGEVQRALTLIERAGATPDTHDLAGTLSALITGNRPRAGRNDPCWCGSGRPYKKCHRHPEELPLGERTEWLYNKAMLHLYATRRFLDLLTQMAVVRARVENDLEAVDRALGDLLIWDVVLFEGGAFEDFLYSRGAMLPDDERSLAERWLHTKRSVHEAIAVHPPTSVMLRDLRTGEINEAREQITRTKVKVGQLYCGRVSPCGASKQIFGGLEPVPRRYCEHLIKVLDAALQPAALVELLSWRLDPPAFHSPG